MAERAQALLAVLDEQEGREWICQYCKESNGGNFEICWHCGGEPGEKAV
jgi:hypothetical protein